MIDCATASPWAAIIAVCYLIDKIIEFWLGKTNKVKSGSMLELVLTGLLAITLILFRRKKDV